MATLTEDGLWASSLVDEDGNKVFTLVNEDGDVVFGVSTTDRDLRLTYAEFEVPSPPSSDRGLELLWAALETGEPARALHVTWAELQAPDNDRALWLTWAEISAPRRRRVRGGHPRTLKRGPRVFFPNEFPRS